ncbi:MAG: glycoside hydrolase family 113 [Thermoanaerobaculia bacterium]
MRRPLAPCFLTVGLLAAQGLAAGADDRQRGVSWVAGGPVAEGDLAPLAELGVDWIVQTPFGWQEAVDSPVVRRITDGHVLWGERDEGLEATTRLARAHGIRTLLKPHLWVRHGGPEAWPGAIAMASDAAWDAWFASYRDFLLHYARLTERLGIEALAVGTELHGAAAARPQAWRDLIAQVRDVYSGKLTYAANWNGEFEEIAFWDDLDWIGIQAYFPLAEHERPTLEELVAGWRRHLPALEALHRRTGKPILFTEIGYRSVASAAIAPWRWPEEAAETIDIDTQARCYEAFFAAVWPQPWLAGAFFWKWYPRAKAHFEVPWATDFTPQGKPAEEVLRRYYRQ